MSCAALMTTNPPTLKADETVADAIARLLATHQVNLPVVDAGGEFIGMFGLHDLLQLATPRMAIAGGLSPNLRFLADEPAALRESFALMRKRTVGAVAARNGAVLHPDTPEAEAFRLFGRNHTALPVADRQSGKLLGLVSYQDLLRAMAG